MARRRPPSRTKSRSPRYPSVTGRTRRNRRKSGLCSGSISVSSWVTSLTAVNTRKAPKRYSTDENRSSRATPAKMNTPRGRGERAEDPPEQDPALVLAGHGEKAEDDRPHEHVVDREALLDHVARRYCLAAAPERGGEDAGEPEPDRDPHAGADRGGVQCDLALGAAERDEVRGDHHGQHPEDGRPGPAGDVEVAAGDVVGGREEGGEGSEGEGHGHRHGSDRCARDGAGAPAGGAPCVTWARAPNTRGPCHRPPGRG